MADNKKQFIAWLGQRQTSLRELENAYFTGLNKLRDDVLVKIVDICHWHSQNVFEEHEPNEGLSGRSLYKQRNILKDLTALMKDIEGDDRILHNKMLIVHERFNKFVEETKYYIPD